MTTTRTHPWRAAVRAFGIGIALWASGVAQAAVYTGIWDPPFGSPFTPDLAWRGSATFSLPSGCVAGTADLDNVEDCNGGAVVTQATVELYDTDAPVTPLATLVFDAGSLLIQTLRFDDGEFIGLSTSLSASLLPDAGLEDYGILDSMAFALQFTLEDGPRLGVLDTACDIRCGWQFNDATTYPATFEINRVSEPGSAALGTLALGLLAAARRRRRA